jgi:hypothetical protein
MIPRLELSIYYEEVDLTVFGGSRIRIGFGFDPSSQTREFNTACNTTFILLHRRYLGRF